MDELKEINNDKLYGEVMWLLYDYSLDKSYEFVSKNTNYLLNIKKDEIKDIKYSYNKQILILLNNGTLYIDGKIKENNISKIWLQDATMIYGVTFNNQIVLLTNYETELSTYINNNNYKYKKIATNILSLVALTHDGKVRAITPMLNVGILPERFTNVDDIRLIVNKDNENDGVILVKQKDEYWSLFVENRTINTNPQDIYEEMQDVI